MAANFQTEAHSAVASGTDIVLSKPSGVVEGDKMYACIVYDDGGGAETISSVPSGWTLVDDSLSAGPNMYVYEKVAGSSEPSTYTWVKSSSTAEATGAIVRVDGQSAITPTSFADGGAVSNDPTPSFAGGTLTPPATDCLLLMFLMARSTGGGVVFTDPPACTPDNPSWTQAYNYKGGISDDLVHACFYATRAQTTQITSWSAEVGAGGNTDSTSILVCVRPRVDATATPSVMQMTAQPQTPVGTGGAAASVSVATLTTTANTPSAAVSSPEWTPEDKPDDDDSDWTAEDRP